MSDRLPLSEIVRVNEIGAGIERRLAPDAQTRARIARALDLASLDAFEADLTLAPDSSPGSDGWRLSGRIRAEAVQTCGVTLEPLPVSIDDAFGIDLVDTPPPAEEAEVEIDLDSEPPDVIEDGRIDLGQYAVEQLALRLDPFPRKPGAEFVQPEEPSVVSPFAALKALKRPEDDGQG